MSDNIFLSVVAPAYNEAQGIETILRAWQDVLQGVPYASEIVICNDGSTDKTGQILEQLTAAIPNLRVIHSQQNGGYGDALYTAMRASRGEYVVTIDSDGQFELADYIPMLQTLREQDLDVVTGFRVRKNDKFIRVLADRTLNLIVRVMFRLHQRDTNCALKVLKGDIARNLPIESRSWSTPTEIMIRLKADGHKVGEMGIQHNERGAGHTKLRVLKTGCEMLSFLFYMRHKLRLYRKGVIKL